MTHLDGSGGGTKGEGIKSVWDTAVFGLGFEPNIISEVSISALLSVPYAIGIHKPIVRQSVTNLFSNFTIDTIFKVSPLKLNGKIKTRAVWRAIRKKNQA